MQFRRRHFAFVAFLISSSLVGCSGGFSNQISAADKGIIRQVIPVTPAHLDPAFAQDTYSQYVANNCFEGLVALDDQAKIVPALAESWKLSNGGKTYIFTLRKGVTFSNSDPLTAADVVFSFNRNASPALHSQSAAIYFTDVVGLLDYCKGKSKSIAGIKAIGNDQVEFDLIKPAGYFLGALTLPAGYVEDAKICPPNNEILKPNQMIGTGAYIMTAYVADQQITFFANPHYWGGPIQPKGLRLIISKDPETQVDLFLHGSADVVAIDANQAKEAYDNKALKPFLHRFPSASIQYLSFVEPAYKPFEDPRVREAFTEAIDVPTINNVLLAGITAPATGILPPGIPGYRPEGATPYHLNIPAAKALLADAGYPNGANLPPLTLYYPIGSQANSIISQAVQDELGKNLGVKIQVQGVDFTTFLAKEDSHSWPFMLADWVADYPDAQDFLSLLLTSGAPSNYAGYSNPEFDALCAKADALANDDPNRLKTYQEAEDIALKDCAWVPMDTGYAYYLIKPRVTNLDINGLDPIPYIHAIVHD